MRFDSIFLLIWGIGSLFLGIHLKISPKKRYFTKDTFSGELFIKWRKKEVILDTIIRKLFEFETYPYFIHLGIIAVVFSLMFSITLLPKSQSYIRTICTYLLLISTMFIAFFPKNIFKNNKMTIINTFDLDLYEKFYNGEIKISPKISIIQEWKLNYWIQMLFVVSICMIPSFHNNYLSIKTLFSNIIIFSAVITIGFIEKQSFHYNFIKQPKIWSKYIKKIRISLTVVIMLITYSSLLIILFYPEIKL